MLIFSGATLPFEIMPDVMQKVISFFPMTQGIQLMKAAFLGLPVGNPSLPIIIIEVVVIVCLSITIRFFKWERLKRVKEDS
jgi:ABC-2 type transport system permease protein